MRNDKNKESNITVFSVVAKALKATFRRMRLIFLLLLFTTVGISFLELVPPFVLKQIIDSYFTAGRSDGLWLAAAIYALASVGVSAIGFGQVFINSFIGQNILLELRFVMADHLSKLPLSYYNRTAVGDTMSRLTSDVETINTIFAQSQATSMGLSNLPTDVIKIIVVLTAMFVMNPALSLIVLTAVPVVYMVSSYFRRNTYRTQVQVRRTVGAINAFLQETFSGMRIVKAYGKEDHYDGYFQKPLEANLKAVNAAAVYDAYFPCVMMVIRAVTVATVVWFGARTGVNEALAVSIGGLAAMTELITRLFTPLDALTLEFQTLQQALAGLKRIVELLQEKPEERGEAERIPSTFTLPKNETAVVVNRVSFGYAPGKTVLKDVSLSVPQGKRIAVVGRTGAGKTTLVSLIAGLYPPYEGSISVLGFHPYQVDPRDRRKLLGVVPQTVHVFEGTIKENITLRDETIPLSDVEKAAKMVGLHDYITSLEKGYDTILGVEGTKLSFGQNQLLSLARAAVSDPALLLLDEPTSGMDAVTEAAIFKAFRTVSQNRTIITISHRLSGIIDADEVHIMASGKIVQSGVPEKLSGESGWYAVFRQLEDLGWKME